MAQNPKGGSGRGGDRPKRPAKQGGAGSSGSAGGGRRRTGGSSGSSGGRRRSGADRDVSQGSGSDHRRSDADVKRSGGQGQKSGGRTSSGGSGGTRSGGGGAYSNQGRDSYDGRTEGNRKRDYDREQQSKQRRDLKGAAINLPRWVIDDLSRVTPKQRVAGALEALGAASEALAESRHHVAVRQATKAKSLAPRDATVRETLGIALYRTGRWAESLSELRTYRRFAGETTHLPVEMDILRALGRQADVEKAWEELERRGGKPPVMKEGRVVYASHLIDQGNPVAAFNLTNPTRTTGRPFPEDLRVWYVAARAAALTGDAKRAGDLRNAILENDPAFPGIDDLESMIAKLDR